MDKVKLKELLLEKKKLDSEQKDLMMRQQNWNNEIECLVGEKGPKWDDLLLMVLNDDAAKELNA